MPVDYSSWELPALKAELDRQAALHEAAGLERASVAEELLARERAVRARLQVDRMSARDREAIKAELDQRERGR